MDLAIALLERNLQARADTLGDDHPATLSSHADLAMTCWDVCQRDRALPLFEQAARGIEKRRFQDEHARRIIAKTIEVYEVAQQFESAETWCRKWRAFVRAQAGAESPAYAGELALLGSNPLQQKKWNAVETTLRECLAIRTKTQPDTWRTFNTQMQHGGALLGQKKYADAEPLLRAGYEGMKKQRARISPQGQVRQLEALERLMHLCEATERPEEAAQWRQELEAVRKEMAK
jgi:hypothetical protein